MYSCKTQHAIICSYASIKTPFSTQKGLTKKEGGWLFTLPDSNKTRGNSFKTKQERLSLDVGKKFFTERVVRYWNKLPRKIVGAPSLAVFKAMLDGVLSNLIL